MSESKAGFDFPAFREAFERKDAGRWAEFYAEDAHWIEYKPSAPPRAPIRMIGKAQIKEFIEAVSRSDLEIERLEPSPSFWLLIRRVRSGLGNQGSTSGRRTFNGGRHLPRNPVDEPVHGRTGIERSTGPG